MKKLHLVKRIAMTMVAMAFVAGISAPVNAEKIRNQEVSNVGLQPAQTLVLDHQGMTGQVVKSWTIKMPVVPKGAQVYVNVYEGTRENSETGIWSKDSKGNMIFRSYGQYEYSEGDNKIVIQNSALTMGKKTVETYLFDEAAQKAANDTAYAAYEAAYDAAYDAYKKAEDEWISSPGGTYPNWSDYFKNVSSFEEYCAANNIDLSDAAFTIKSSNSITIDVKKTAIINTSIKSTSIELRMDEDNVTGYEIYRKVGKGYKKLAKVARNVYLDKNLISKTKYTYKVRPYYYNEKTGKTLYGIYSQFDATTIGSRLTLQARMSGKKNVKLSWKKVPNAIRYEVYRSVDSSSRNTITKGESNWYSTFEPIKTLKKSAKSYTDKKTIANRSYAYKVVAVLAGNKKVMVEESAEVSLWFEDPEKITEYVNAKGAKTVEWRQVYGAEGYIIKKQSKSYNKDIGKFEYTYTEVARQGKNKCKRTFNPPVPTKKSYVTNGGDTRTYWENQDTYYIYAYQKGGKILSEEPLEITVYASLGVVSKVSAKKVANGIQVSWTPVAGASYYEVYRVKAGALVKNNDNGCYESDYGCYESDYGSLVYEYVGAREPVKVDVVAWNAERDAYQKDTSLPKPAFAWDKLDPEKEYYYKNYEYAQHKITKTSMIDYSGEVYGGNYSVDNIYWSDNRQQDIWKTEDDKFISSVVEKDPYRDYQVGPKPGIEYQYYVIAVMAEEKAITDYEDNSWNGTAEEQYKEARKLYAYVPGTINAQFIGEKPIWKKANVTNYDENGRISRTYGCKKIAKATYTTISTPKKTSIKSLKAGKKSVTVTIKKATGAKSYRIYRATKKKGPYQYVGSTTKTKFKDKGLKSGKTYYYRVLVIKENEAKADVVSPASKVKKVKAK